MYDRFQGRVGYIVITKQAGPNPANSTYSQLYEGYGVGVNGTTATGHYQLLAAENGVRTFAVVPGAQLRVAGQNGNRVIVSAPVSVDDETTQYTQEATISDGIALIRVAQPGEYTVNNRTVAVSKEAVTTGGRVNVTL